MRNQFWIFLFSLLILSFISQLRCEATRPVTMIRPESPIRPEGNTTFLDGTTWCVARPSASQAELQRALDWACGIGRVDCSIIEKHGDCYEPDTIWSHASFAFNAYYQTNGNNRIACYFGGTATLTKINPSYGTCSYDVSKSEVSSARSLAEYKPRWMWLMCIGLFLFLYRRS
ncbi:Carbohydrate-binding X8 domain superfamily protein [Hirschfeldia incana]|nr:Carbohydrate-binding X8 domain superfamily protein [Hirschfeldia incana]